MGDDDQTSNSGDIFLRDTNDLIARSRAVRQASKDALADALTASQKLSDTLGRQVEAPTSPQQQTEDFELSRAKVRDATRRFLTNEE